MIFNEHSELEGKHAFLSASKYHWLNYDEERLAEAFDKSMTAALGTRLHNFAKMAIDLGIIQANTGQTLNMYINDCIGFKMRTEQMLVYSRNAFGTCDAISFRDRVLRIFDLKNGVTATKVIQLEIYAALFCLEYDVPPASIEYDLRIYQNDEVRWRENDEYFETRPEDIKLIMEKIVDYDRLIEQWRREV